jgi:hypothetical protein
MRSNGWCDLLRIRTDMGVNGEGEGGILMDITVIESTFHGRNATLERYDESVRLLGGAAGGPYPDPGSLFHWVDTKVQGGGLRIVNVFWTREQWDVFLRDKLLRVRDQVGLPSPDNVFTEVDRFMTAGR